MKLNIFYLVLIFIVLNEYPFFAQNKAVKTKADAKTALNQKKDTPKAAIAAAPSIAPPKTNQPLRRKRPGPAREFRGVWVSTVQQVDFPSHETVDPVVLKREWMKLVNFYKSLNLNAIIVQVRPTADAIYPSKIVPYSKWLTGKSGKPIDDNFDLLKFMIETSHNEGFEFHAWINPYRVFMDNDTINLAPNHIFKTHRNWVLKYGKEHHLNPGIPDVWRHLTAVTEELVKNYDIDAIHFDDYFYPYRIDKEELQDSATFKKYGKDFKTIDDWRRANTDSMMFNVRQAIKKNKPSVQLGISPFAVWRNQSEIDSSGSATHAYQTCYGDLYADVLSWLKRGWLDYVAPEVYFHKNHPLVPYETAVDWWLKNSYGTPVYISHAIYKVNNKEKYPEWRDPAEIPRQLDLVRTKPEVKGLVFFSSRWLVENQLGVSDSIRNSFFYKPALLPLVGTRSSEPVQNVSPQSTAPADTKYQIINPQMLKAQVGKSAVGKTQITNSPALKSQPAKTQIASPLQVNPPTPKYQIIKPQVAKVQSTPPIQKSQIAKAPVAKAQIVKPHITKPSNVKPQTAAKAQIVKPTPE